MIVTDIAAAAGAASVPGPATDVDDDGWFVHEWFQSETEFGDATGIQGNFGNTKQFDSKAKRIIEEGQVVVVVVENLTAVAFSFALNSRCLSMVRGTR